MLNVNMDKHPHRINERRMGILKGGGGLGVSSVTQLPHRPI